MTRTHGAPHLGLVSAALTLGLSLAPAPSARAADAPPAGTTSGQSFVIQPYLLSYQPVTDTPGLLFSGFWPNGRPNAGGQWPLVGELVEPGGQGFPGTHALVIARPGEPHRLVAQTGRPDPGPNGLTFDHVGGGVLHDSGRVTFGAAPAGQDPKERPVHGIYTGVRGDLRRALFPGDRAPGTEDGVVFGTRYDKEGEVVDGAIGMMRVSTGDRVAFFGNLVGPTINPANDYALFEGPPDASRLLVREGAAAPGAGTGVRIDTLDRGLNSAAGRIGFAARLAGDGVDESNDVAIYYGPADDLRPVLREGSAVPGMPDHTFASLAPYQPDLTPSGKLFLYADVSGPGGGEASRTGLWFGTPDAMRPIVQVGDEAPGTGGKTFTSFMGGGVNEAGEAVFLGIFDRDLPGGGNDVAVFAGSGADDLRLIAKQEDPDIGTGRVWSPVIGPNGQVAFSSEWNVFATHPNGELLSIARINHPLEVSGQTRIVDETYVDRFLDDGRLLLYLNFRGGGGGLYAVSFVPEPGAAACAAAGVALLLMRRRRRTP
jgi:hypothetical protein